ncbi:hypothetical protein [Virgisporangium aurantiacum]|uniref:Uncharacterized protein n=1 Tax=Virgisporangium aurantiacum TaxID=175570 RepID=A0A8J4DYS2_9ACTN|nr:hypothetical protein [Virgisporangium aurantiacum]GIJ54748.1 hypothetical protein Vau01_022640 [Virgisporangium aurantiacum]
MSILALTAVVTAGVVALQVVLLVLWRWRGIRDRRVAALLPTLTVDPYHVLLVRFRSDRPLWREAAARLLLDGLITVDHDGALTLPAPADDTAPTHPLTAALLDHVRHAEGPVVADDLGGNDDLRRHRETFERDQDARLVHSSRFRDDGIGGVAGLATVLLGCFYTVMVVIAVPGGPLEGLCAALILGPMIIGSLGWLHHRCWPRRRDLFAEHCATLPLPGAIKALDPDRLYMLDAGMRARTARYEEEQRRRDAFDSDSGGF